MPSTPPNSLAEHVWRARYRALRDDGTAERCLDETFSRVATALAAAERDPAAWRLRFAAILDGFRFLPGGRILAGAGTVRAPSLLNCFVMGPVEDTRAGILRAVGEGVETLVRGGGIGWDLSTLAPAGGSGRTEESAGIGPVGFLKLMDTACELFTMDRARGGAMIATLRDDHPELPSFMAAKSAAGALPRFNLSVQLRDAFLEAVDADGDWPRQPDAAPGLRNAGLLARTLWETLLDQALHSSEPGVLFVDTINRENNLHWRERLTSTNPCGEVPLPPYGSCDLGSLNLPAFVSRPFTAAAAVDLDALAAATATAVRMLDDVLDATAYPLARQREVALATRRIGLGITGLGDALAMLGLAYGSQASLEVAAGALRCIKLAAYRASVSIAREKGAFPAFDAEPYLAAPFVRRLPGDVRDLIARHGIRNSHLLAIAPTGSISLLAGNVSPGLEPIPARRQRRRLRLEGGDEREFEVEDRAWALYRKAGGLDDSSFVEASSISPESQVDMQAALQAEVDGAISKTVLLPDDFGAADLGRLLRRAHAAGVKGLAVHRSASTRGNVLLPGCGRSGGACEAA